MLSRQAEDSSRLRAARRSCHHPNHEHAARTLQILGKGWTDIDTELRRYAVLQHESQSPGRSIEFNALDWRGEWPTVKNERFGTVVHDQLDLHMCEPLYLLRNGSRAAP